MRRAAAVLALATMLALPLLTIASAATTTTPANNTKGALLAVRFDRWQLGYKRRNTFETQRSIISDSTAIVMHMRIGMIKFDDEASAITYNITV